MPTSAWKCVEIFATEFAETIPGVCYCDDTRNFRWKPISRYSTDLSVHPALAVWLDAPGTEPVSPRIAHSRKPYRIASAPRVTLYIVDGCLDVCVCVDHDGGMSPVPIIVCIHQRYTHTYIYIVCVWLSFIPERRVRRVRKANKGLPKTSFTFWKLSLRYL